MWPIIYFIIIFFVTRDKLMSNLIKANIVSVTRMTKLVVPAMVKREKGVVINIGSASSIIPSPLLTVYAATKVWLYYIWNIITTGGRWAWAQ